MKSISFVLIAVLFISGCASNLTYDYYGNNPEYKTDPRKIVISEGDIKDKKYELLGEIEATASKATIFSPNPTREEVNYFLLEKASRLGADAIIDVHYGSVRLGVWSWGELDGSGKAVKFID